VCERRHAENTEVGKSAHAESASELMLGFKP